MEQSLVPLSHTSSIRPHHPSSAQSLISPYAKVLSRSGSAPALMSPPRFRNGLHAYLNPQHLPQTTGGTPPSAATPQVKQHSPIHFKVERGGSIVAVNTNGEIVVVSRPPSPLATPPQSPRGQNNIQQVGDGNPRGPAVSFRVPVETSTGSNSDDDEDPKPSSLTTAKTHNVFHRLFEILSSNWKKITIVAAVTVFGGLFVANRMAKCERGLVASPLPFFDRFGITCPAPFKVLPLTYDDFLAGLSADELVTELKKRAETSGETKKIKDAVKATITAGRIHVAEEKKKSEALKNKPLRTFDELSDEEQDEITCLAQQSQYRNLGPIYLSRYGVPPEDCKNPSSRAAKQICTKEDAEKELDKASLSALAILDRATHSHLNPACQTHATIILGNSDYFTVPTPENKVSDDAHKAQCKAARKAYRILSLEVHPDKASDETDKAKRTHAFSSVSTALSALCH